MKYSFFIMSLLCFYLGFAQDKHLLYNQTHNPQSLMLNPGAAYEKTNIHIGVPLLSNIYASAGNSVLNVDNLFNANDFNSNVAASLEQISSADFVAFNQKLDLINIGFRHNNRYYTAGVYQESDGVLNFPKDLMELAYFGNAGQDRSYDIGEINFRANLQTVFHIGVNQQVNKDLHLGVRGKLYTSSVNIRSVRNTGQFNTGPRDSGILLDQSISNLNLRFDSTGLEDGDELSTGNILIGSNYGLGLDFGLSYFFSERWEFTASVLDFGFIHFSRNTRRDVTRGFFEYDGLPVEFPRFSEGDDLITYYQNLGDDIEQNLPTETTADAYTYMQPAKLNLGLSYNFGGQANSCDCGLKSADKQDGNQTLSLHGFSMVSANNVFYSLNAIYERSFWKTVYLKFSFGIDQFNQPNFGGGLAVDVWKINLFANLDRLNHLDNIYNAEALAFQFGLNLKL